MLNSLDMMEDPEHLAMAQSELALAAWFSPVGDALTRSINRPLL
jgi:hypothetical protein